MQNIEIKICGITSLADAHMIEKYSPNYLGFIFHAPSPRNISIETLQEISEEIKKNNIKHSISLVGVFVNPSLLFLEKVSPYLDIFQLHGEETPEFSLEIKKKFPEKKIWKAFRISSIHQLEEIKKYYFLDTILIDSFSKKAHGGTGKKVDEKILKEIKNYISPSQQLFIAGGITAENKNEIIHISHADGIDISSSIEKYAGKKDEKKVKDFFLEE